MSSLIEQIKKDCAKGTQGNWQKDKYGILTSPPHSSSSIITVAGLSIAHMSAIDEAWCDEYKANTRRISRVPEMELALIAAHEKIERLEAQNEELRAQDANGWRTDMENALTVREPQVELMIDGVRIDRAQYDPAKDAWIYRDNLSWEMQLAPRNSATHWRSITLPEEGE